MTGTRTFFLDVALTMPLTFVSAVVVTYLYSLVVHDAGAVDWATAFHLAMVLGIVLPLTRSRSRAASRSD